MCVNLLTQHFYPLLKILSIVTNKIKQGYLTLTFFFLKEDCDLIAFDFTQDSQWEKKKKRIVDSQQIC